MPRMNILNTVEREAFDSPPVFNSVQRKQYFDFPSELRRLAGSLRAPTHQLCFLLSTGYFKAAKRFFLPGAFHRQDLEYVARQLELVEPTVDLTDYSRRTRQFHQLTSGRSTVSGCLTRRRADSCSARSPAWSAPSSTQGHVLALCRCPGSREDRTARLHAVDQAHPRRDQSAE